jgi:hypothetical protein
MPGRWEQLWVEKTKDNEFILCCIPFFAYGIALGDEVSVRRGQEFDWLVDAVLEDAGEVAVRAALISDDWSEVAEGLIEYTDRTGLPWEIHNQRYVAISCPRSADSLQVLVNGLESLERNRKIEYELSK